MSRAELWQKRYEYCEARFPEHVIIQREGYFWKAWNKSAEILACELGYQLVRDSTSNRYFSAGPNIEKIERELIRGRVSYVIVSGRKIISKRTFVSETGGKGLSVKVGCVVTIENCSSGERFTWRIIAAEWDIAPVMTGGQDWETPYMERLIVGGDGVETISDESAVYRAMEGKYSGDEFICPADGERYVITGIMRE